MHYLLSITSAGRLDALVYVLALPVPLFYVGIQMVKK